MRRLWSALLLCLLLILPMRGEAAGDIVRLSWEPTDGAVLYEVILTAEKSDDAASAVWRDTCSANGIEVKTVQNARWWRVRGIDYDHRPVSEWSEAKRPAQAPRGDGVPQLLFADGRHAPVYPVYTWIPVWGAVGYEIEISDRLPTTAYLTTAGSRRIKVTGGASYDCYEDVPALREGAYYWRVRALYDNGGRSAWSKTGTFMMKHGDTIYGALGDSITHGGGFVTHTPNEPSCDWTTYTNRRITNLGLSGDTVAHIADRVMQAQIYDVKVLFILGGINDIRAGGKADAVTAELARAVRAAKKNGIRPILLTAPPVNPKLMTERMGYPLAPSWQTELARVNAWILAQEDSIDTARAVTDKNGYLAERFTTDGLHPDSKGKRRIGEAVRAWLDEHRLP